MANPITAQYVIQNGPGAVQAHNTQATFVNTVGVGNTIIAFATLSDAAGIHADVIINDNKANNYQLSAEQNTNPSGGAATLYAGLSNNSPGGTTNVICQFTIGGDVEDFQACLIIDVGNANGTSLVGFSGNTQNGLASGSNNINSGPIVVVTANLPCIMYSLALNTSGSVETDQPTPVSPLVNIAACWNFGSGGNLAAFASQTITTAGTYTARWNQQGSAAADIAVVSVIVQGIPSSNTPLIIGRINANGTFMTLGMIEIASVKANAISSGVWYANSFIETSSIGATARIDSSNNIYAAQFNEQGSIQ
jgi:hypothetical protein